MANTAAISLKPLTISAAASQKPVVTATAATTITTTAAMTPSLQRVAAMLSSVGVTTTAAALRELTTALASTVTVSTTATPALVLTAVMLTGVSVSTGVPLPTDTAAAWCVNWATGASTNYEQFEFNSFAMVAPGEYLGAKADGLYLLDGDTDDGKPVRASLSLGLLDLDSNRLKHLLSAHAAVASSGELYLKVTYDVDNAPESYIYRARGFDTHQRTQRFDLGRGIRAHMITFELFNGDGADFELRGLQLSVLDINRRI